MTSSLQPSLKIYINLSSCLRRPNLLDFSKYGLKDKWCHKGIFLVSKKLTFLMLLSGSKENIFSELFGTQVIF